MTMKSTVSPQLCLLVDSSHRCCIICGLSSLWLYHYELQRGHQCVNASKTPQTNFSCCQCPKIFWVGEHTCSSVQVPRKLHGCPRHCLESAQNLTSFCNCLLHSELARGLETVGMTMAPTIDLGHQNKGLYLRVLTVIFFFRLLTGLTFFFVLFWGLFSPLCLVSSTTFYIIYYNYSTIYNLLYTYYTLYFLYL